MIDEKKLIERFKQLKGIDSLANMFISDVIREIKKQPKVGEWIPCGERLPEKTGYYLAQLSRKLPSEDYADRIVVLYNGEDKEFMTYKRLIVAWMPLPEPYIRRED